MRIGYISDSYQNSDYIYECLSDFSKKYEYAINRIIDIDSNESIFNRIKAFIELSDIIIANVAKGSLNITYEIGLAHGLNKPVVIFCDNTYSVPDILKNEHFIFRNYQGNNENTKYLIEKVITSYFEDKKSINYFKYNKKPFYLEKYSNKEISNIEDIFGYDGHAKHMYLENWFKNIANDINEWELFKSNSKDNDSFDFVFWNNINSNDFEKLGNPIALELKSSKYFYNKQIKLLIDKAIANQLQTIIILTLAEVPKKYKEEIELFKNINALIFDKNDLLCIKSARDFLKILSNKIINKIIQ